MTNREILFRGFHPCEDGGTTIYVEGEAVKGRWVEGWLAVTSERIAHINVFKSDDGEEAIVTTHPVIPSTVGQYTGLTDISNNKIFEHDILLDGEFFEYKVKWIGFYGWQKVSIRQNDTYHSGLQNHNYYEVIGTIFDKPKE